MVLRLEGEQDNSPGGGGGGLVAEGWPYSFFLCKNFDVFICEGGPARFLRHDLGF